MTIPVKFITELDIRIHPHPPEGVERNRCFQLRSPLITLYHDNELVQTPAAFWSDGGSIPWWLWSLLRLHPLDPHCARAFFSHDFNFAVGFKQQRLVCDQYLYYGMLYDGATHMQARMVYMGVRLGSWRAWNNYRRKSTLQLQKNIHSLKRCDPMFELTVENWCRNLDGLS